MKKLHEAFDKKAATGYMIPTVIEKNGQNERGFDIYSRLLRGGIVFVTGPIDDESAMIVVAQLLHLRNEYENFKGSKKGHGPRTKEQELEARTVNLYINSPGGEVNAGMAIYDTINDLKDSGMIVRTVAIGCSMSMGSVLLVAGSEGHRYALPSANIMIHQPSGGAQGKSTSIANTANEIEHIRHRMAYLYEAHTKMDYETAIKKIQTDYYIRAEEAKSLGIVDHVMYPKNMPRIAAALREANEIHAETRPSNDNPGWRKPAASPGGMD